MGEDGPNMMNCTIEKVYKCYLGRSPTYRAMCAYFFLKNYSGDQFFEKYSTNSDSVVAFMRKIKENKF